MEEALRKASLRRSVYLFGHDLKWALNGIQIADSLGVASGAYLVTSRYDDPVVQGESQSLGMKIIPKALASRIPLAMPEDNKMPTQLPIFILMVARNTGEALEECSARTLDGARRHAQDLLERDPAARKVTVLEKDTYSPLGSVDRHDGEWRAPQAFPSRRMAWH